MFTDMTKKQMTEYIKQNNLDVSLTLNATDMRAALTLASETAPDAPTSDLSEDASDSTATEDKTPGEENNDESRQTDDEDTETPLTEKTGLSEEKLAQTLRIELAGQEGFSGTIAEFLESVRTPESLFDHLGLLESSINIDAISGLENSRKLALESLSSLPPDIAASAGKSITSSIDKQIKDLRSGSTNVDNLKLYLKFVKKTIKRASGGTSSGYGWEFARSHAWLANMSVTGMEQALPHMIVHSSMLPPQQLELAKVKNEAQIFVAFPLENANLTERKQDGSEYVVSVKEAKLGQPKILDLQDYTADKFYGSGWNKRIGQLLYPGNTRNVDAWQGISIVRELPANVEILDPPK